MMWSVSSYFIKKLALQLWPITLSNLKQKQKMKIVVVLACLVISAVSASQNDSTVACYMDASMQHILSSLDPFWCTHIIYSIAYIGDDFSLKTLPLDMDRFNSTKKMLNNRNPALKMLLGVGVKPSRLELLSQQQITLDKFINSTLEYVTKNNYDGVDLTWLENDSDATLTSTKTLISFSKELRGWIDQTAEKTLLVTVSLLDHSDHISRHIDKTFSQYIDFICPLLLTPNDEGTQIDNTVSYWQDKVGSKKVILALPAIVQQPQEGENSSQPRIVDMNPESTVEQMNGPVLIIAKQVCQAIKSGQKELKTLTKLQSVQSHGLDVSWLQKGLGGVGVVMLDIDNFLNSICLNCTQSEKAILEQNVNHQWHGHHGHHHHRHGHHGHHYHRHGHHGHHHHMHGHHGHHHHMHGHHGHHHHRHGHHGHHHHHAHGHRGHHHHHHHGHGRHGNGHHGNHHHRHQH